MHSGIVESLPGGARALFQRGQTRQMDTSHRQTSVRAALLVGVVYFLIGRLFALPADHVLVWRLAAWLVSGIAYASHIGYEHDRRRNPPRTAALHAALAVAIGALGLALAGMIQSVSTTSTFRPTWILALVVWPAVTAVPAFLVALAAGMVLEHLRRDVDAE